MKAAIDRHHAKANAGFVINPGIIAGPLLDIATDVKVAQKIAEEVTQQVQQAGGRFEQEAGAADQRCQQVITDNCGPSDRMMQAATPEQIPGSATVL